MVPATAKALDENAQQTQLKIVEDEKQNFLFQDDILQLSEEWSKLTNKRKALTDKINETEQKLHQAMEDHNVEDGQGKVKLKNDEVLQLKLIEKLEIKKHVAKKPKLVKKKRS